MGFNEGYLAAYNKTNPENQIPRQSIGAFTTGYRAGYSTASGINTAPANDKPSLRKAYANIYLTSQSNPEEATEMYKWLMKDRANPASENYYAYSQPTSYAAKNLAALGFDTSGLDDDFFNSQEYRTFMVENLERSDTTGEVKSPSKKSSVQNQQAYYLNKYYDDYQRTKTAKSEYNTLMNTAMYLANDPGNYSDDEILAMVNGELEKKYPTLNKMKTSKTKPVGLTEGIDFSDDAILGAIWMARNPEYTGGIEGAMANSYLGTGNQWQENKEISSKITALNEDGSVNPDYMPYSVESTTPLETKLFFGRYGFDDQWVQENKNLKYYGTDEQKKQFAIAEQSVTNYNTAEKAANALSGYVNFLISNGADSMDEVQDSIDTALAIGKLYIGTDRNGKTKYYTKQNSKGDREEVDLSILNKIDASVGKQGSDPTGELVPMGKPFGYKYDTFIASVNDFITANNQTSDEAKTTNDIMDDVTVPEAKPETEEQKPAEQEEIDAVSGADVTAKKPETKAPEAKVPEAKAPAKPKYTPEQAEQIKAGNKNIKTATVLMADIMTDDETAVMENAGSVAFGETKSFFDEMRTSPEFVKRYAERTIGNGTKSTVSSCMDYVHSISEYKTVETNLAADREQFAKYEAKYGPLEYLQEKFEPRKTVEIGDFEVTMVYDEDAQDSENRRYVVESISAPSRGATNYEDILNYSEQGIKWASDLLTQADKAAGEETERAKKVIAAHALADATENGEEEVANYKTLSSRIKREEDTIAEGKELNDARVADVTRKLNKLRMARDAAETLGMDTSEIDQAFDFIESMDQFYNEPPLPVQDMSKLEYIDYLDSMTDESVSLEQKRAMLHNFIKQIDGRIGEIDNNQAYADKTGYNIPDRYAKNMKLTREDLVNERKAIEYELIITDSDPDQLRKEYEAGKAFEKKYGEGNMDNWNGLFGVDNFKTLRLQGRYSDPDYDVVRDEEEIIYYSLLGKKVLEMGDDLDAALDQIGKNPQATREALETVFSDAYEYQKFMQNEDTGFGMWANREFDRTEAFGREMVESGTVGGIVANAGATANTWAESISSAWYILDRLITGNRFNKKSSMLRLSAQKNETREATRESINKYYENNPTMKWIANIGYEIYCNRGDSMVNAMFFGAILPSLSNPIFNELLGSMPMGATAGLNSAIEAIENGASTEQAWFILGTSFLAETISEALTRSNIMEALGETGELTKETVKNAAIKWLTESGVEELIGETSTDIFENWANQKATEWFDNPNYESDHQKRIDYYYAEGYTEPGEAEAKAYEEELKNYVHTAFVSYLSSGTDVLTTTGRAAVNTVTAAKDMVNFYRSYTKADQKLGGGNSMLANMKNDFQGKKNPRPSVRFTDTRASAQEASAAAPSTEKTAAPVTTEERYNNAQQALATAEEAHTAAKADYDTAYKKERSWRKELNEAKKELKQAEKSGNQEQIASAKEKVNAAQQEYNAAKAAKEEARTKRNEASETLASVQAERDSAEKAYAAEQATSDQKQAASDVLAIGRVDESNTTTQTEMIASILDNGDGDETVTEQASAAAAFLGKHLGADAPFVVQQVMSGTKSAGISREVITTALQNAALGNGAATAVIQSEEFKNASNEDKARMLADTVEQDQNNASVQGNIANSVKTYRTTMGVADLAAKGHFDQAQQAQEQADKAAVETAKAETQLQEKQDALDEATKDVEQKANAVAENPTDDNMKQHADAVTRADNADESRKQYEEHLAKQQEAQKEADAKAQKAKEDAMTSARETASQTVAQQDQQRAQEKEAKAEQQRQEEEAKAKAQAEQDEMTGKADEDRRAALVEQLLDNEKLQGEERDARREKLMNQLDKVKVKITDLKQSVSNTEGRLALYAFERKLGIPIEFADLGAVDGNHITRGQYVYNKETGEAKILLNENLIKSGKMSVGQALVEASLHEILHGIKNTKSYDTYRSVVMESLYGSKGKDAVDLYNENSEYRAAIDTMIADRSVSDPNFSKGKTLDDMIRSADEEIVADFARMNLAERAVVNRLMDAGLGGRMRNTLHNINQALKNYFGNLTGEERKTAEYLRRAERAYQKAMNEAAKMTEHPEGGQFSISQIAQATGMSFDADTLTLTDKNGNIIDGVNNRITADMINETPVGMLIDNGLSDVSPGTDENGNRIPSQREAAKDMMAGLMNMVARYKDSDLVWEIGATTLSSTFSALKSNSDPQYKTTVDFGTVCAKTQAIIDTLSQVMLDKVKNGEYGGLTRQDIMKVYDAVNQAGLSVPCPVCYVFSRWMGVPSLLGQMSQYQHDYVVTNEDGSINKAETQKKVDDYIKNAEAKYGDAKAINNQKTKLQNKLTKLEEKRTVLEAEARSQSITAEQKADLQKQIDSVLDEMVELDKQIGEVSAYNWVTQALCKKDKSGKFVVDDAFKLTPDEILFDLNRTGEFAGYAKNWKYRNTRGAGMGKAIMPYSGETIGDILYGVKSVGRQSNIKNPWLNMDSKAAARQLKDAQNRAKKQNLVGGQRLQSTSDFRPEWGLDYVMSFLELQAAGSKVQMYTKVAEAVDFFASVGADVNLSIMGKGQGWHIDDDGNYVLDFSSVTGMDYETAKELKNKYDNVQMILVGMNDTHIRLAMANSDIDFIIPWHSSGNSQDTLKTLIGSLGEKLDTGTDYSTSQSDTVSSTRTDEQKALWDARMTLLTKGGDKLTQEQRKILLDNPYTADLYKRFTQKGVDDDCYGVKLSKEQAGQIFPYEYWDTTSTKENADINGQRFVEYCEAMGIVPRFSQFKDDTGYWKLLIDRPMYNNDGSYHNQQVIDVTNARIGDLNESGQLENSDLPTQAQAKYAPKDPRNPNYAKYTEAQKTAVENAEAAINTRYDDGSESKQSVYGDLTAADRDLMTDASNDYEDAVARQDWKAAQEDVDFYAEQKGYSTEDAFHGTPSFGFTLFDMIKSQGDIFVSYNQDTASTYTKNSKVRPISDRDIATMSNESLADFVFEISKELEEPTQSITYNPETGMFDVVGPVDPSADFTDWELETMEFTRDQLKEIAYEYYAEDESRGFKSKAVNKAMNNGIYKLYTRPGKQLVVEANGATWSQIPWSAVVDADASAETDAPESGKAKTRDISKWAKEHGYDSVRINQVIDNGTYNPEIGAGDIGIFFNQQDVKSADPVTYDDNGKPIPLDQRFTDSPDIRYSSEGELTEADRDLMNSTDQDYKDAVARQDWKAAQEDVDFYAEQKGYPIKAYHGSPQENITQFDINKLGANTGSRDVPGFFFTNNKGAAEAYLHEVNEVKPEYRERYEKALETYDKYHDSFDSLNGWYPINSSYGEYVQRTRPEQFKGFYDPESAEYREYDQARSFLRSVDDDGLLTNPKYTDRKRSGKVYDTYLAMDNPYVYDAEGASWVPDFWQKVMTAAKSEGGFSYNGGPFDGIIVKNFYDFDTGEMADEYVVFDPNQIKSADPVTYDDNGNVIPLDQRFTDSPDIRYSSEGELTEADRDLMNSTDQDYKDAVAREDWKKAQEDIDRAAERARYTIKAFHGTPDARGIGNYFDPEKSITGPMPFFTESEELASEYAKNKQLPSEPELTQQYQVNGMPIDQVWDNMSDEEKATIADNVRHIEWENGELRVNPDKINGDMDETIDLFDGNAISAIFDELLGFNGIKGEGLVKAFELAGINDVEYINPRSEKVYSTYLKIQNPFDVATMYTKEFLEDLETWWMFHGSEVEEKEGIQGWHKSKVNVYDWIAAGLENEIPYGATMNWTMIPDGVTDYLKSLGYDGIKDTSGKHGGDQSTVWIPFYSEQIKLADPVTYDDNGNIIPPSQRFNPQSADVRYSAEGELSAADRDLMEEQELNQTLAESGALTAEEVAAYEERYHKRPLEGRRPTEGEAQRAFGDVGGMLEKSDEISNFAKSVVKAQNTYFPDTNFDQINRAVDWIKSQKGGYAEALDKVTGDSFDYRSADGQARMVAMMGLAAAKDDVIAQASLADAFNRQGTDLGRALQARKLFMLMTPEGRKSTLRKMLQNAKDEMGKQGKNVDLSFSEWIYEAAAAAETQEDMRKVQQVALAELGEQLPSNWKDRLQTFRMLSMLANPRTHIRNIIGNAMFIPAVSLKNKLGAVMELGVKKGEKTKTLKPIASKESRAFAREDAELNKGLLTGEAKYSEAEQIKQNQAPLGQFVKALSDLNGNFLEGEDWFFLKGHYRRALSGWMEANGYTAEQLRNDQTLLEKGRQYAISEAQKATYRDFSKAAQTLNQISRNGGALGFMLDASLPFKKTPINILRRGIEYSPVGIAKSLTYDLAKMKQYLDYQNGKLDVLPEKALSPTQVIDHICSGLSGTAITALGFLLAGSGVVSCGLDDDEDKFEKEKGNQEYAIKVKLFGHDVTFTIDWAAPMSMPFFVGAAIRNQMDSEGAVNVNDVVNGIGSITEPVFNLSMLDGVNSLLKTNSYDNSNPIMQILSKMATNYASSFVPSALGALARTIDDTRRKSFVPADQSQGFTGNLMYAHENSQNKIPFYNQENIPVRDIWGNEDRTGFAERLLENFILPGYINEYKEDPIINEMARLYEATGDNAMIPKSDPDKTISYTVKSTKEKVKHVLTDKEWDKYKEVRGKTAFTELTELMENEDYQNASTATQVQMIKNIWSHANDVGKKAVIPDIDLNDPVETSVGTIAKDSKIASTKNEMIKALNAGDYDAYDTMVQALYDEGLEESDVRAKIRDYYRDQYKDAYRKGLKDRVTEIKEILDNTGIDFSDLIDSWQEAVDNEQT